MGLFSRVHVHLPYSSLRDHIPRLVGNGLNPELYVPKSSIQSLFDGTASEAAARMAAAGLTTSVHGPFADLSPGAMDSGFRELTRDRMNTTLRGVGVFAPASVVFHPGYDPLRFREHTPLWLRNSVRTWTGLLPLPPGLEDTWIVIENIFEEGPTTLAELLARLPSPPFGFCLDTGHFQLFSREPLEAWFEALGARLREVHLHDNGGESDAHLPPGRGCFDFPKLFKLIDGLEHPVIGTLEMHREQHMFDGLRYLEDHGVL